MKRSNQLFNISSQVILLIILGFTVNCQLSRREPYGHQPPPTAKTPGELIDRALTDTVHVRGATLSEKKMKAMIEQSVKIWNKGKLALVDKFYAPEFVRYHVDISEKLVGLNALKKYIMSMRAEYPDFTLKIDELLINDDLSVLRWTFTGTNAGPIGDLRPTGKKVQVSGVTISRFISGKINREWAYWNQAAVLQQLGYTITPPENEIEK